MMLRMSIIVIVAFLTLLAPSRGQSSTQETLSNTRKFPSLKVCGSPKAAALQNTIVGGRKANLGAYPWMANIGYKRGGRGAIKWLCGGTLVTDQHVLTAAHCLHPSSLADGKRPADQWTVVAIQLGDLDIDTKKQDGAAPQIFDIDKVTYHEKYSNIVKENDLGIIKLKKKVQFTDLIKPICLPSVSLSQKDFVGEKPTVAGWGANVEGIFAAPSSHLMEVTVEVQDLGECRSNVTKAPNMQNNVIDNKVICAASPGKDSCQGDSGGPLMYFDQSAATPSGMGGNWFQIGIVSYGYGCARPGFPGVYARVSSYMSWIDKNIVY